MYHCSAVLGPYRCRALTSIAQRVPASSNPLWTTDQPPTHRAHRPVKCPPGRAYRVVEVGPGAGLDATVVEERPGRTEAAAEVVGVAGGPPTHA